MSTVKDSKKRSTSNLSGVRVDLASAGFLPLREEDEPLSTEEFQ